MKTEKIKEIAVRSGAYEVGLIDTGDLVFHDEIRKICEGNSCRNYNAS